MKKMMTTTHLTIEEILNFITMDSITPEGIQLAARVNCHIMQCEECRKKVEIYQIVNDKLSGTTLSDPKRHKDDIGELEFEKKEKDLGSEIR